jgi:hypothetical protein
VESLARSINLPIGESTIAEAALGASHVISAGLKRTRSIPPLTSADPRLIPPIVSALRDSGQLRINRPERPSEFWKGDHEGWYVWELTTATPVMLPLTGRFPEGSSPKALNVWVADPIPPAEGVETWGATGCFLFLVEELGDFNWPIQS